MDQSLPNQQLPQQNMPQNPTRPPASSSAGEVGREPDHFSKIAFWKIGVIETLAGAVILLLIFGVLNYFNILPLSDVFPKYFSWLPRREVSSGTSRQKFTIPKTTPTPTSSPIPQMTVEKVKEYFLSLSENILTISAAPIINSLKVDQDKVEKDTFAVHWKSKLGSGSGTLVFGNNNETNSISLFLSQPETASATAIISESISKKLFSVNPQSTWKCKPLYEAVYCENFWENSDKKTGISIFSPTFSLYNESLATISFCEFTTASELYPRKSCTTEFADTGVQ